ALRLGAALWRCWETRGHLREGLRWLEAALVVGDAAPADARAGALNGAGNLAWALADYDRAEVLHRLALQLRRAAGDSGGVAGSLANLGNIAKERGKYAAARSLYEESLPLYREVGDARGVAYTLGNLG